MYRDTLLCISVLDWMTLDLLLLAPLLTWEVLSLYFHQLQYYTFIHQYLIHKYGGLGTEKLFFTLT